MRLERLKTLPLPRRRGLPTSPEYKGKFRAEDVSLPSLAAPVKCLCEAVLVWEEKCALDPDTSRSEGVRVVMGALMVIFSLQPKQKAKTKGRLPFFTSPPHLRTLLHRHAPTCCTTGV